MASSNFEMLPLCSMLGSNQLLLFYNIITFFRPFLGAIGSQDGRNEGSGSRDSANRLVQGVHRTLAGALQETWDQWNQINS
jgi:hypothetical protein